MQGCLTASDAERAVGKLRTFALEEVRCRLLVFQCQAAIQHSWPPTPNPLLLL